MRREEIIAIMGTMRVAYPRFYQAQTKEEVKQAVDLWSEMFSDDQTADVVRAVKELISELEFPPTIANVKQKIKNYIGEREWEQFVRDHEEKEQEERARILAASETPKLEQPKLSKEERMKYLAKCRETLAKGEKNDRVRV